MQVPSQLDTMADSKFVCRTGKLSNRRLPNRYTDCFGNSAVNTLVNFDEFYFYITQLANDPKKPVSMALQKLFIHMTMDSGEETNTNHLRSLFPEFDDKQQHDVFDFIQVIIGAVADEEIASKKDDTENTAVMPQHPSAEQVLDQAVRGSSVLKLFTWVLGRDFKCTNPECEEAYEIFSTASPYLQVHIPDNAAIASDRKLETCIGASLVGITPEDSLVRCAECNTPSQDTQFSQIIKNSPEIAMLQLMRSESAVGPKKETEVIYPANLELAENKHYKIRVVANHLGTTV